MGRFDEAATQFEFAIETCRRDDARPFLARSLWEYAVVLHARDLPEDAARATACRAEALAIARAIGMRGLERKIEASPMGAPVAGPATAGRSAVPAPPHATRNVFRREGDFWTVSYGGEVMRLRDARGLQYLATLLHRPGHEFHATELVAMHDPAAVADVSADDVGMRRTIDDTVSLAIDPRAQSAYRARMRELEDVLSEAEDANDLGRTTQARTELAALREALVDAATGRRSGTHGERARVAVTKGIGTALARIKLEHPSLAAHLGATIRRGYFCVYVPDPRHPIEWD
jgi:hypothetical protein